MLLKIENLFMRWKRIIEKSGSLELADPNKDYNLISTYIRQGNPRKIAAMVAECRDCSLAAEVDAMLKVVAYQCTHCNKYHIGHNRLSYRRLATA